MRKDKLKTKKIKIIYIMLFILVLFGIKNCYGVVEYLSESSGDNYWFNNPYRGEQFSDFYANIGGNRALCINKEKIAHSGNMEYVGDIALRIGNEKARNAAAIMYYSSTPERRNIFETLSPGWEDTAGWKSGLDGGSLVTYNRLVDQMAFWHEVDGFDYNAITLNDGWDGGEFYETRMHKVQLSILKLLTYARNMQTDFIVENNMSITVDSSGAVSKTNGTGTTFVGPYKVNAQNLDGQITLSKKSGNTGITVDVNGIPISSINSGGEVYVRFDAGDKTTAEFNVTGRTKSQIVCQWWRTLEGDEYQDFAILDLHEVNASTSFPSTPGPIPSFQRKVYVRHIDADTKALIPEFASSSQLEYLNGLSSTTRSVSSATPNDSSFLEMYTYASSSTMNIVKSSKTKANNGKNYTYLGGKKAVASNLAIAKSRLTSSTDDWGNSTVSVVTDKVSDSTSDYTVIEFQYKSTDEPPTDTDVKATVHTYYAPSPSGTTTYIPSGEDIKPYIISQKFIYNSISYNLEPYYVWEDHGAMGPVTYTSTSTDSKGKTHTSTWTVIEWIPHWVLVEYWHYVLVEFKVYRVTGARYGNDNGSGPGSHFSNKIIGSNKEDLLAGGSTAYDLGIVGIDSELQALYSKYSVPRAPEGFEAGLANDIRNDFNENKKTSLGNFGSTFNVPHDRYNGLRRATGYVKYNMFDPMSGSSGEKNYVTSNENYVNVYTPAALGNVSVSSDNIVDHTVSNQSANIIQKNADFTVQIARPINAPIYSGLNSSKYVHHYYVIFDMDILLTSAASTRVGNSDVSRPAGYTVKSGTPIRVEKNGDNTTTFRAKATSSQNTTGAQGDIVNQLQNKITVIAATYNMPESSLESNVLNLNNNTYITSTGNNWQSPSVSSRSHSTFGTSLTYKNMFQDAFYFAKTQISTNNIGRIYDFKITDCTDVNFKDVFRKTSTITSVNDLTGNVYYSGVKALKIYTNEVNILEDRKESEIYANNKNVTKLVPLGPYKHVSGSYIQAPKMGYKISFDLKTSGYYDGSATKTVEITPSYYYISKDATTFLDSSEITLYYKDSSGNYKKFENSGYNIAFKPNDGYRSVYNQGTTPNLNSMSQKLENLDVSKKFTLTNNMMSSSDNSFIQAWYGEFKLPNSTLAVKKSGGSINNPLKDGYIGVRFDMVCVTRDSSGKEIRVSYNQDDKKSGAVNTTQWDYEGYLGIKSGEEINSSNTVTIKLEKANWTINNQGRYKRVISTVALFDLDNRAANDFD